MVCVWAGKGWVGVTTVPSALPPFFSAKALVHPHASNTHVSPLLLRFLLLFFSSPFFLFLPFFRFLFSLPGCKAETGETNSEQGPSIIGDVQAAKDGGGSSRITSTAV